ncbi:RHS repeat domain-containing protein [Paenibacillus pini]|uniref:Uncharacterized protein n=1 Tax=Paenibacillus pini JCM 16418 TaxID=1236976 RepID=W7Z1B0_9BACL|nr:hypothetical protein [Paenibacillus pini]GAF08139.1 hypothetical protein JCM16418_2177 [Paenibacillus pini JCM 16418]
MIHETEKKKRYSLVIIFLALLIFLNSNYGVNAADNNNEEAYKQEPDVASQDKSAVTDKESSAKDSPDTKDTKESSRNKIFDIRKEDRELLKLENTLLSIRKIAAENKDGELSREIYMKYLELNQENITLHDFNYHYEKNKDAEYIRLENNYYEYKKAEFLKLQDKYETLISDYAGLLKSSPSVLNLSKSEISTKLDSQNSINQPVDDISINKPLISKLPKISVTVTVYYVQPDNIETLSVTDDVYIPEENNIVFFQKTYENVITGKDFEFSLPKDPTISDGTYLVEMKYSDSEMTTDYFRVAAVPLALTSNRTINVNDSFDVSLGAGETQVFEFTATSSKAHRIFTNPYGGVGGSNDTVLEIYSDAALTNMISRNDDYNGTVFSSISFKTVMGTKYYVKLRTYSSSGSLYCRLSLLSLEPIVFTETSAQYVYNASNRISYILYASGRQIIYLYDNNGNLLRKVLLN